MKYDYLVVGSGLFGSIFAYEANKRGKKVLVIDKRPHLGGNIYTEKRDGINVHIYGAHIFHTSNKEIWNYINRFAEFNRYTNSPVARYKDELYNLPFNMNTFHELWSDVFTPEDAMRHINEERKELVESLNGGEPANLEEQAISLIGKTVYEKLIKGYTEKQWGMSCKELPAFIIKRLPVRLVYDNNYFNNKYQGIPIGGYTQIIEKMLGYDAEGNKINDDINMLGGSIELKLNYDYFVMRFERLVDDGRLWSVIYDGDSANAFNQVFSQWNDFEWLTSFFKENADDLNHYFHITDVDADSR